jgi:sensor histidine kinase YesM
VPLGVELDWARRYLDLQQRRFGDRLRVEVEVPAQALPLLVPRFVLQPLLENAIQHGLERRSQGLRAELRATLDGSTLSLSVADDGPGFPAVEATTGIGLANLRARLATLHGAAGELRTGRRRGGGALVELRIPARMAAAGSATA